jgi:hypothetical protein
MPLVRRSAKCRRPAPALIAPNSGRVATEGGAGSRRSSLRAAAMECCTKMEMLNSPRLLAVAVSGRRRMLLRELTAQPSRSRGASRGRYEKNGKTRQISSNWYPWISIASERWIDSIEIISFPFSCCTSTPSNPCRQPPRIRTRYPAWTNACREKRPFSCSNNCRSSICFGGTGGTFPPKLTKPIRPAVFNTACRATED